MDQVESFFNGATGIMTKARYTSGGNTSGVAFGYNASGQSTSIVDWYGGANTSLRYAYDDAGRLTRITDYDDATLDYVYDAAGNVVTMTDYHDSVFTYTYGSSNNLVTLSAPGGKNWVYTYNDLGQAAQVSIPNGMTTAYSYDTRNRLTKIEHKDGANVLDGFTYALDDQGNVTKTTYQDSAYWDYWYDGRNRLTKAERKDSGATLLKRYTYTYSIADNMTTKEVYTPPSTTVTTTFAYNPANELTTQTVGGTTTDFAYDAWGRLTNKDDGTYSADYYWNYGDKLTRASSDFPGEGTVDYAYGGDGKRRERDDGTITKYRWRGGRSTVNIEDSDGTLVKTYVGHLADLDGTSPSTGAVRYYFTDAQGSVRRLRDASKSSLGLYEYTPFGETYSDSGASPGRKYIGLEWDAVSGLYYAPYRFLSPASGRWLSRDPLGHTDGLNLYIYGRATPIMATDSLGLKTYLINRTIRMGENDDYAQCLRRDFPISHTFVAVTDDETGEVIHTYTWAGAWLDEYHDQDIDKNAAREALREEAEEPGYNKFAKDMTPIASILDRFVEQAWEEFRDTEPPHHNFIIWKSCKNEAKHLIRRASELMADYLKTPEGQAEWERIVEEVIKPSIERTHGERSNDR